MTNPLNGIHRRMVEEKLREQAVIRARYSRALTHSDSRRTGESSATLAEVNSSLIDMKELLTLDMAKREIFSAPTWPFDT